VSRRRHGAQRRNAGGAADRTEMLGWMNHHTCCRLCPGTSFKVPVTPRLAVWANISALATGFGTLVLAVATFAAVRSANRAARAAERSLLAGLRPLLVPSRLEDGAQKVFFGDSWHALVPGGGGIARVGEDDNCGVVYLAASLRNAGNGIGVLHGWLFYPGDYRGNEHADPEIFTRQTRDLYIPAGDTGFWQGAFREPDDPAHDAAAKRSRAGSR
jgi:hypothetical protein